MDDMAWKVDLPRFLKEIAECSKSVPYAASFRILAQVLKVLTERAIEINDPALNIIMLRLGLYEGAQSIIIDNGKVYVNGNLQEDFSTPSIEIKVEGNVGSINTTSGDVTINGDANSINTASGDVDCHEVKGSVHTMSGDVTCGDIAGSVNTMSGNVYRK